MRPPDAPAGVGGAVLFSGILRPLLAANSWGVHLLLVKSFLSLQRIMNAHSSEIWKRYYLENSAALLDVPWDAPYSLSPEERLAISKSIAEFQRGESSEGKHLISGAREYAAEFNDPAYVETTVLFIKEEQRHARDLRRYMTLRGIPPATSSWPDAAFRFIRHLSGLEVSICVLVTAEIIAQCYYPALKKATADPALIGLCDQIISDEESHVAFQTERIASLRSSASPLRRRISELLQRILFTGTVAVVWVQHHPVFARAGLSYAGYRKECWSYYRKAERLIRSEEHSQVQGAAVLGRAPLPEKQVL
jgi:hypothetical protein